VHRWCSSNIEGRDIPLGQLRKVTRKVMQMSAIPWQ